MRGQASKLSGASTVGGFIGDVPQRHRAFQGTGKWSDQTIDRAFDDLLL